MRSAAGELGSVLGILNIKIPDMLSLNDVTAILGFWAVRSMSSK